MTLRRLDGCRDQRRVWYFLSREGNWDANEADLTLEIWAAEAG
jgi:hypothetical protein